MNAVCEVCGDVGYRELLLCCRDCKCSAAHQYCLEKVVFDASLVEWWCYECLQGRGEVTCSRSLEKVSSERPPCHAHLGSTVHQPISKRVEWPWRNRESKSYMAENVPQLSTLQNDAVDKLIPYSLNDGCEKAFSCPGIKNMPSCGFAPSSYLLGVDFVDISSISQHDTTESSEGSGRLPECQKGSFCNRGKTVEMATASSSSEESGEDIPSENESLVLDDDLHAPQGADYILAYRSYLSEAQKERIMAFIREIQAEITVFVAVIGKISVQLPGPFLAIPKEYAMAHFPHETTYVTLQSPGKSKKWRVTFYKRDKSRKYMLTGRWLDFVRDNHVQEGDICLLLPTKCEGRSTFTVYLLCATATHSRGGAGFQSVGPCPCGSSAKTASEVHNVEKPINGGHVSTESDVHNFCHESSESEDSGCLSQPSYVVPCRNTLSKSQKKIVEERVRTIRSKIPICVAVMKNNNAGSAQRWMLELGKRYAEVHLPARGQTVVLECMGKTWKTEMKIHNGRRWFLNGGWTKFALDNGLRVGDICLFELKKNDGKLTAMKVHIISREQF